MKVRWRVETGYVDRIPPFEVEIDDEALEGLSETERQKVIEEYVEESFREEIGYTILEAEDD